MIKVCALIDYCLGIPGTGPGAQSIMGQTGFLNGDKKGQNNPPKKATISLNEHKTNTKGQQNDH